MSKFRALFKCMEVFRMSFKMQIVWRFDVAMTMVATVGRIIAAWIVWQAIFSANVSSVNNSIEGFSFSAMLSYYIISAILSSVDFSPQISGEVSDLIRAGRFSGHMVTPMNPFLFFSAMTAGESAFHLGFSLLAAAICAIMFQVNVTITSDAVRILIALAMIPTGLTFMSCYHYFIGILTFKFFEIEFFMHVQGAIIAFATGSLVPLSLLSEKALSVLCFLPFTHVVYTPAMLLCGQLNAADGFFSLAVIVAWAALMPAVAQFTYSRLRVKYDGVGI
jgi:ABC-2 type transport system permease protein